MPFDSPPLGLKCTEGCGIVCAMNTIPNLGENKALSATTQQEEFRKLPAVDTLLRMPSVALLAATYGQRLITDALRTVLDSIRVEIRAGASAPTASTVVDRVNNMLEQEAQPTLRAVINATGVIVHTNLGRAPLSRLALTAMNKVATGYSNLEYDLAAGMRGSRHDHARRLLCALTGAEDALVINNNAAAVYFVLTVFCQGREVVVSRGELVEIGGGFRIPDVLRQSGAKLKEVGTTNRTHARDFAEAIGPETAALMRIHTSNFKQIGFVTMPPLAELAAVAHAYGTDGDQQPLLIDDLGSGTLLDTTAYGLAYEPMVQESIEAGADLVTFSGDKLLGGPQAGVIVGRKELIAQLRRHPMARALRVDKLTLAALDATLRSYQREQVTAEVPVWQMISATATQLRERAAQWQTALAEEKICSELIEGHSAIGGGSLPGETLPTVLLALSHPAPDQLAEQLRQGVPAVVGRIQQDRFVLDPRTVLPTQEAMLLTRLTEVLHGLSSNLP